MKVLIDTQIIIWLATGAESQLTPAARRCFFEADELFCSIISYWEIALKRGAGKLGWDDRRRAAFERGFRENGIQELALES